MKYIRINWPHADEELIFGPLDDGGAEQLMTSIARVMGTPDIHVFQYVEEGESTLMPRELLCQAHVTMTGEGPEENDEGNEPRWNPEHVQN